MLLAGPAKAVSRTGTRGYAPPPDPPAAVYRGGGKSPSNLTARPNDNGMLSARDSLSNPWPLEPGQQAPLPLGKQIQVIDTSKLPPESVIQDGAPYGPYPAGHVSIGPNVPVEVIREAIVKTYPKINR